MKYEEYSIQAAFVEWINLQHKKFAPYIIHIPNGGKMNILRGYRLKKMGVRSGVADILFMWRKDNFGGLWLEFKSSNGKQSQSQKEFENNCHVAQYDYQVVKSLDEAILAFNRYMDMP